MGTMFIYENRLEQTFVLDRTLLIRILMVIYRWTLGFSLNRKIEFKKWLKKETRHTIVIKN